MSLFQFNVVSAQCGSANPYSPEAEAASTRTLEGVQSAQIALTYPRQETYGWDGAGDLSLVERPRAELALNWVFASGLNEVAMGMATSPSGTIPAFATLNDERNWYLRINQDGIDTLDRIDPQGMLLSLGNGVVTKYDFTAQLNQPSTVGITVEGLNLLLLPSGGSGQALPSINKQAGTPTTGICTLPPPTNFVSNYFEAMPSAIQLTFPTGSALGVALSGNNSCPVDSFGFSVDLPRAEVKNLGWAYPESRPLQWPITVGIHAEATVNQFQLDALSRVCPDSGHSFTVGFRNSCSTSDAFQFQFEGAKLDAENLSVTVGGGPARVSLNWTLKIADPNRRSPNFFLNTESTAYDSIVFPQLESTEGVSPLVMNLGTACYLSIASGPASLIGNTVTFADTTGTVIVRATAADGSDVQDITFTIA